MTCGKSSTACLSRRTRAHARHTLNRLLGEVCRARHFVFRNLGLCAWHPCASGLFPCSRNWIKEQIHRMGEIAIDLKTEDEKITIYSATLGQFAFPLPPARPTACAKCLAPRAARQHSAHLLVRARLTALSPRPFTQEISEKQKTCNTLLELVTAYRKKWSRMTGLPSSHCPHAPAGAPPIPVHCTRK